MQLDTKHAYLGNHKLIQLEGADWKSITCAPICLIDLMQLATDHRLTHLWIAPDLIHTGPELIHYDESTWNIFTTFTGKDENRRVQSLTGWKKVARSGNHQFTIIFLENTMWHAEKGKKPGPFHGLRATELLYAVSLLERELGVPVASSPQTVGWKLLQKQHPRWLEPPRVDLRRDCHYGAAASRDIIWQCPPSQDELKAARVIVRLDKSMAFTYASATTDVGEGTPTHVFHGQDAAPPVKRVGIWLCEVGGQMRDAQTPFPSSLKHGKHWLVGPMINLMRAAGFSVEAEEGWIFPEQHDLMVKWAGAIWDARQHFENFHTSDSRLAEVYRACAKAVKKIANSTIGSTGSHALDEAVEQSGEESDKRRPDLRNQVQARNAELVFWNLEKCRKETGRASCIVYMDSACYLLPDLNVPEHLGPLMARNGQLGGWRFDGYLELDSELRALLADKKAGAAAKLQMLNLRGWQYGPGIS